MTQLVTAVPPVVSAERGALITETAVLQHESGPYYVYAPGEAIHRREVRDSLPHIWGGLVSPVTDFTNSEWMAGGHDHHIVAADENSKMKHSRCWASATMQVIFGSMESYGGKVFEITAFQKQPLVEQATNFVIKDNLLARFNGLICPWPHAFTKDGLPPVCRKLTLPDTIKTFIEEHGALALRSQWLKEAAEKCELGETGRLFRQAIDEMQTYLSSYRSMIIGYIEAQENEMAQSSAQRPGKRRYDPLDDEYLYLLGRKPRTIQQAPQVVVQQAPAPAIDMNMFGDALGASLGQSLKPFIDAATAPLREEIAELKRNGQKERPRLMTRNRKPKQAPVQTTESYEPAVTTTTTEAE